MDQITVECSAKINLGLDVINKRSDGYHNIKTIMQEIDLKDEIIVRKLDYGFIIKSNSLEIPKNEENLVYKVWDSMKKNFNLKGGVEVYIDKKIPVAAGLAGGSTNAAAMLKAIDRLWDLNCSLSQLEKIGGRIGADIPFCLRGGTVIAEGIGDEFTEIQAIKHMPILLVNPNIPISTADVYGGINLDEQSLKMDMIIEAIKSGDIDNIKYTLYNKLEDGIMGFYSEIEKIKQIMMDYGAIDSLMSGSGATVFGIFKDLGKLEECKAYFENHFEDYKVIETKTL